MEQVKDEDGRTYRSVSQAKEYAEQFDGCPYRYYLKRVEEVWQRPAAWLPQGTAVHAAVEAWEKSGRAMDPPDVRGVYGESFAAETRKICNTTPNLDYWFPSGRYGGLADLERRWSIGLDQLGRYMDYCRDTPNESIWQTGDGMPAVELPFEIDLDGVPVRGYADQVIQLSSGGHRVRDVKTGRKPGDEFQLAVYGRALNETHPALQIKTGDYWMGRMGKPTMPYKLDYWSRQRLVDTFGEVDQGIREERFDPKPAPDKCRFCPVSKSCDFFVS